MLYASHVVYKPIFFKDETAGHALAAETAEMGHEYESTSGHVAWPPQCRRWVWVWVWVWVQVCVPSGPT